MNSGKHLHSAISSGPGSASFLCAVSGHCAFSAALGSPARPAARPRHAAVQQVGDCPRSLLRGVRPVDQRVGFGPCGRAAARANGVPSVRETLLNPLSAGCQVSQVTASPSAAVPRRIVDNPHGQTTIALRVKRTATHQILSFSQPRHGERPHNDPDRKRPSG